MLRNIEAGRLETGAEYRGAGVRQPAAQQTAEPLHVARTRQGRWSVEAVLPGAQHRETGASWLCAVRSGEVKQKRGRNDGAKQPERRAERRHERLKDATIMTEQFQRQCPQGHGLAENRVFLHLRWCRIDSRWRIHSPAASGLYVRRSDNRGTRRRLTADRTARRFE